MLTDTAVKQLKSKDKPYREADRDGLYLLIEPTGVKKWQFRFSWDEGGKKKRPWQSLGRYPDVSLKEARAKVMESRALLAKGVNPIQYLNDLKSKAKQSVKDLVGLSNALTFSDCYDEYCKFKTTSHGASKPAWQYDTLKKHNERFGNFVLPVIGSRAISSLSHDDLRDVLLAIQAHGTLVNLKKVRTVFNGLFDYAAGKGYIKINIAKLIPDSVFSKHVSKNFKHVTTDADFKLVVNKVYQASATVEVLTALKLALLLFLRPSNVVRLKWSQVDLEGALISISADEMKTSKELLIPLSKQAVELLQSIEPLTGHTEFVFYSPYGTGKPISRDSLSNALKKNGITEVSPHGLRHTASTLLHDKGFDSDAIELQLSHVIGGIRGVYNKAQYMDKRIAMMQEWSDYIEVLKND